MAAASAEATESSSTDATDTSTAEAPDRSLYPAPPTSTKGDITISTASTRRSFLSLWRIYVECFEPLRERALLCHVLERAAFESIVLDDRVFKVVGWMDGRPVGLARGHEPPRASCRRSARRSCDACYPEHAARQRDPLRRVRLRRRHRSDEHDLHGSTHRGHGHRSPLFRGRGHLRRQPAQLRRSASTARIGTRGRLVPRKPPANRSTRSTTSRRCSPNRSNGCRSPTHCDAEYPSSTSRDLGAQRRVGSVGADDRALTRPRRQTSHRRAVARRCSPAPGDRRGSPAHRGNRARSGSRPDPSVSMPSATTSMSQRPRDREDGAHERLALALVSIATTNERSIFRRSIVELLQVRQRREARCRSRRRRPAHPCGATPRTSPTVSDVSSTIELSVISSHSARAVEPASLERSARPWRPHRSCAAAAATR